ncbi:MAG: hypothetical protein NC331_03450 [Lachnospiraceae bacterium]|nr:hypothetical protein [Lachnospiraceae bacterium]
MAESLKRFCLGSHGLFVSPQAACLLIICRKCKGIFLRPLAILGGDTVPNHTDFGHDLMRNMFEKVLLIGGKNYDDKMKFSHIFTVSQYPAAISGVLALAAFAKCPCKHGRLAHCPRE